MTALFLSLRAQTRRKGFPCRFDIYWEWPGLRCLSMLNCEGQKVEKICTIYIYIYICDSLHCTIWRIGTYEVYFRDTQAFDKHVTGVKWLIASRQNISLSTSWILIDSISRKQIWLYRIACEVMWRNVTWHYIMWYDMIWYDVIYDICYDMIYDMIWYDIDMIWYDMIWYMTYDMTRHGTTRHDMAFDIVNKAKIVHISALLLHLLSPVGCNSYITGDNDRKRGTTNTTDNNYVFSTCHMYARYRFLITIYVFQHFRIFYCPLHFYRRYRKKHLSDYRRCIAMYPAC